MYRRLVSHNADIRRLAEKGYAIAFDSNYLVVRDIPYLDEARELKWGAFVVKLVFPTNDMVKLEDHQVFFAGGKPYNVDGTPVANLNPRAATLSLSERASDVQVTWQLSNKPQNGFADFYEKVESYSILIAGPATEKCDVTPFTFKAPPPDEEEEDSVFLLRDSLTSRAEIGELSAKLHNDKVAIIGLGGTGAYVLDYLVRTPIREIRCFDPDDYHIHNAFRSPGKVDEAEFSKKKADIYRDRYQPFRNGLIFSATYIDRDSAALMEGVTFAFVCVDKGSSRTGIFDLLMSLRIPFIDVGMDLRKIETGLTGLLRTTYYPAERAAWVRDQGLADLSDSEAGLYRTHIQIGELNALNAALAVIRFKQLRGFYADEENHYQILMGVMDLATAGESLNANLEN
ncbi:MAG: ThiF family adenylyltransferase [Rectinemataceae bacterium]